MKRAALAMLVLAGCSTAGQVPPPDPAATAPTQAGCRTDPLADLVGRKADVALGVQAVRRSGAKSMRVLGPDIAATTDYRPDRLNATLDARGIVTGFRCG